MDLSSLILVLSGYNKIFYSVQNNRGYSQNELTIKDCIKFANYKIESISLTRDGEQINVFVELGGLSVEDISSIQKKQKW